MWYSPPSKPEQTNRNAESTNKSRWETIFRLQFPLFIELWLDVFMHVPEERRYGDKDSNQNS